MHMSGHYLTIASYNIVTDHLIQLDTCVYFQFIPIFGFIISVLQLLTIAIDRVLSLMSFYNPLVEKHMKLYVALQILPSCLMGAAMSIWLFVDRNSNERVLCFVPTPMMGIKYELLNRLIIIAGVLIILCYVFFIIYLRKIRLNLENSNRSTSCFPVHRQRPSLERKKDGDEKLFVGGMADSLRQHHYSALISSEMFFKL
ncbi:hypothetical protein GCK32_003750 [Trichostrongylus colubriformis]|uniref:G-protein coupled receptors family 1 profile domain-containing protein n=1 Tax=Trichostrongylus colubriformis TaxID=6319 RepID=A0AAN8FE15_TRICO